jgi:hypothetical protein
MSVTALLDLSHTHRICLVPIAKNNTAIAATISPAEHGFWN